MKWNLKDSYLEGTYGKFSKKIKKLACFDMDGTLIKTKSGYKFAKHENDWLYLYKNIPDKLQELINNNYQLVVFSNQRGLNSQERLNSWKNKINKICQKLDLPIKIFAALQNDSYRKPRTNLFTENFNIDELEDCFYVGDACGRKSDFSDTDYKFALNLKINFFTPENFFKGSDMKNIKINYPFDINNIKKNKYEPFIKNNKELILMVGYQGSGKSYYTKNYIEPCDYICINRDKLGTMKKCEKECKKLMELNKNIVIDNTNPSIKSRKNFINLAKNYNYFVRVIEFTTTKEQSIHNMWFRHYTQNKPIIPIQAFNIFKKYYESPNLNENIDKIERIDFALDIDETSNIYLKYCKYYH